MYVCINEISNIKRDTFGNHVYSSLQHRFPLVLSRYMHRQPLVFPEVGTMEKWKSPLNSEYRDVRTFNFFSSCSAPSSKTSSIIIQLHLIQKMMEPYYLRVSDPEYIIIYRLSLVMKFAVTWCQSGSRPF